MNTDKIFAESIANEYAPKDTSKVMALRKLDARAKLPAAIFTYSFGINVARVWHRNVPCYGGNRWKHNTFNGRRYHYWHSRYHRCERKLSNL